MTNTTNQTTTTTTEFVKMVKAEKLRFIASLVENVEVQDFLNEEAVRVERKNSKRSNKKSPTQLENDSIREEVVEYFATLEKEAIAVSTQIFEALGYTDFSSQKQTALLKPLADNGTLTKVPNVPYVVTDDEGNEKKYRKMGYQLA